MNKKSLKVNTALNTFRMLLTVLVPFVTFPYTSRIFLPEGNGRINFVVSVVQIFTLLATLGIYCYGVREGAKVRNDRVKFSQLVNELFFVNLIATASTYVLFFAMVFFYPPFIPDKWLFLINGLAIGFTALGMDWVFGALENYVYITFRQIIIQIFTVFGLFVFVHSKEDIYVWMIILTISNVGANVFNYFYVRKFFKIKIKINLEIKKHIKPILILFSTAIATNVYANLDVLLLGIMTTPYNVGLYTAALKMNIILITMFSAMTPVYMPKLTEFLYNGNYEKYYSLIKKIFRLIVAICLPAVVGLEMICNELIVVLAGDAFADAAITMKFIVPIILLVSCTNIFYYNVLVPNGDEKFVLICTVVGVITNLVVSIFLIPFFKEIGAAVGSLVSQFVSLFLVYIFSIKKYNEIKNVFPNMINYLLGVLLIVTCCFGIQQFVENIVISLICCIIVSCCSYIAVLFGRKDEMVQEVISLLYIIARKIKK